MKTWQREIALLEALDRSVPEILASQKDNGEFGTEPWISTDQNVLLPLAAAWSLTNSVHYRSETVLRAIEAGGLALQRAQDEDGMFVFRKKDHSTWGPIYMPWVYSRWIRAFALVKEALADEPCARWREALLLGYDGIARTALDRVHNIPTHHAMGLYCAGQVFERPDWREQARHFMAGVVAAQSPNGWWAEHKGPVVAYNLVYAESLGVYYSQSGDATVLKALERAAAYHATCLYPDGSLLETVDGRNAYHQGVRLGNVGLSQTPEGRGFLQQQHVLHLQAGGSFEADYAAHMLLYGADGERVDPASGQDAHKSRIGEDALVVRRRPWFYALSAFTTEIPQNRWGQDRQNFLSVYHDAVGLVLGGGNTKLQPLWSNFTAGDTALLAHTPGEEEPDFSPRPGLVHVPQDAVLDGETLKLDYGVARCSIAVEAKDENELHVLLTVEEAKDEPVAAHITLIARLGQALTSDLGACEQLGEEEVCWENLAWVEHAGWLLELPAGGVLRWPVLPHNPYRKDGAATIEEARLVFSVPLQEGVGQRIVLRILA